MLQSIRVFYINGNSIKINTVVGTLSIDLIEHKLSYQSYDTRAWVILKTDHMEHIEFYMEEVR